MTLYRVKPGVEITAQLWNQQVDEIRAARNLTSDGSVRITRTPTGIHIAGSEPGQGAWFQNADCSGNTCPAHGLAQIVGVTPATAAGNSYPQLQVAQPNASLPRPPSYLINGAYDATACAGGRGYLPGASPQLDNESALLVLYDTSATPKYGDVWVPKSGQWSLTKPASLASLGSPPAGFFVYGIDDPTARLMWVTPMGDPAQAAIASSATTTTQPPYYLNTTTTQGPGPYESSCPSGQCKWTWNGGSWDLYDDGCGGGGGTTTTAGPTTTLGPTTTTAAGSTTTTTQSPCCPAFSTTTTTGSGGTTTTAAPTTSTTTTTQPPCSCAYPSYCGTNAGECTYTQCIQGMQSVIPTCSAAPAESGGNVGGPCGAGINGNNGVGVGGFGAPTGPDNGGGGGGGGMTGGVGGGGGCLGCPTFVSCPVTTTPSGGSTTTTTSGGSTTTTTRSGNNTDLGCWCYWNPTVGQWNVCNVNADSLCEGGYCECPSAPGDPNSSCGYAVPGVCVGTGTGSNPTGGAPVCSSCPTNGCYWQSVSDDEGGYIWSLISSCCSDACGCETGPGYSPQDSCETTITACSANATTTPGGSTTTTTLGYYCCMDGGVMFCSTNNCGDVDTVGGPYGTIIGCTSACATTTTSTTTTTDTTTTTTAGPTTTTSTTTTTQAYYCCSGFESPCSDGVLCQQAGPDGCPSVLTGSTNCGGPYATSELCAAACTTSTTTTTSSYWCVSPTLGVGCADSVGSWMCVPYSYLIDNSTTGCSGPYYGDPTCGGNCSS